ncbi:hypothetical protein PVAP13_6NG010000 [Panicum virgatum]|uniref:Uncharacterized protein n=1 Tax=Panicum virgatum TaxID=38727 RepID=A0A8T0QT07_PANVG|nr:hypothetical protein PVAP13_6NG010000 [Panicum virgatum]
MAAGGGDNGGAAGDGEFYLRYYVGHKGKFGHEFLEFEFRPDGKLRYANNSNYKNDTMIRKEVFVSPSVLPRPHRPAGARDRHGQRAHLLHHLQDRLPRRCPVQQGPGGPPDLLLPRPGSEVFCVFAHQPPLQDQTNSVLSSIPCCFLTVLRNCECLICDDVPMYHVSS